MTTSPPTRKQLILLIGVVLTVAGIGIGHTLSRHPAAQPTSDRQAEVAAKGSQVMPFDLERTTHTFTSLPDGGRQTVTAENPADTEQIRLIREHLQKEADAFGRGDFNDPTTIHGPDMPGVAELAAAANRVAVRYQDLPAGAELTYATSDPALVKAIHAWFTAQLSDHGAHAQHG